MLANRACANARHTSTSSNAGSDGVAVKDLKSGKEQKLGIRCNSIHPGSMDTPMVASMGGKMVEAGLVTETREAPRQRLGSPEDIANTALFLASDDSRFVNGAKFVVDNAVTIT